MTKKQQLEELDSLVLTKMIEWIKSDKTDRLPELSTTIAYLRTNNIGEDKAKQNSEQDEMKKKIAEAKKARNVTSK